MVFYLIFKTRSHYVDHVEHETQRCTCPSLPNAGIKRYEQAYLAREIFFFLGNTSARTCGVHCESQHFGGRGGGITEFVARLVYILSTRAVRAM